MRIYRRELFRQFATAAAGVFCPTSFLDSAARAADSSSRPIHLDRNESAYGPSEKARDAFRETLAEANRYPGEEVESLRAAVAALQGVQSGNVTLGCGSREILRMAADVWLGPGKSLVTASPSFDSMAGAARVLGAEVRSVPLNRVYAHDLEAMLARAGTTTGLIYICNPNNPTGTLTPKAELEAFLGKVPSGVTVVIDEAYHDYVAPTGSYASWVARAATDPRLIVTRTFSKIYGLAGLRLGYAVSSMETAKRLSSRSFPMDVNVVAAHVALAALSDPVYVRKIAARTADDRQEFFNQANARMLRWIDSHTNFVLLATGRPGQEVADLLRSKQVLVTAGFPAFENYIRVSIGLPEDMASFWSARDGLMQHHPM